MDGGIALYCTVLCTSTATLVAKVYAVRTVRHSGMMNFHILYVVPKIGNLLLVQTSSAH